MRLEDLRRLRPAIDSLLKRGVADSEFKTIASAAGIGELTLEETLRALARPGVDDRDAFDASSRLRTSALSLADLKVGDVVEGVVRNVVPLGAFVDVGVLAQVQAPQVEAAGLGHLFGAVVAQIPRPLDQGLTH